MLPELRRPPVALAAILFFLASGSRLFGYALEGPSWPVGSTVNVRLAFTSPGSGGLQDGFVTFNASAANALALWNWQILDELISQIVVSTSDRGGNEFSRFAIDPNTVPLNLNRALLYYAASLYRPPRNGRACTSPVSRYSEITSSSRAQRNKMPAEMQPSPNRFNDRYIVVNKSRLERQRQRHAISAL